MVAKVLDRSLTTFPERAGIVWFVRGTTDALGYMPMDRKAEPQRFAMVMEGKSKL